MQHRPGALCRIADTMKLQKRCYSDEAVPILISNC